MDQYDVTKKRNSRWCRHHIMIGVNWGIESFQFMCLLAGSPRVKSWSCIRNFDNASGIHERSTLYNRPPIIELFFPLFLRLTTRIVWCRRAKLSATSPHPSSDPKLPLRYKIYLACRSHFNVR